MDERTNNIIIKNSLNRPAWTSTDKTGLFDSHKYKHSIIRGKFSLQKDFFEKGK